MGTGHTWLVVAGCAGVVGSIAVLGCGGGAAQTGTNPSDVPSRGGASGAPGPAPGTSGAATSNVVGSGGATGNGGAAGTVGNGGATGPVAMGGTAPGLGNGGAIGSGGTFAGGTGGVAGAAAGASAGGAAGTGAGGGGAFANLHVYGNTTTLELAPVLLAAQSIYPAKATVTNGGIPNLFSAGQADIATNAETQALRQSVAHPDLRIVFTVCEGFYRIVARKSAGVATLSDLRGKRIGTTPSTSSAFYLHKMLATVQLTESDVTVVAEALPSQMPSALSSHAVDAVTIWEPEIQNAADALGTDAIEFQDRSVYRELFNLNTTSEKLGNATTRRSIVEFVKSLVTASAQIRSQPSSVWPLVATTTGYDAALIAKAWDNEGFAGTLVSDLLDVLADEETWVAKSDGRTARSRSDLAPLIDDSVLKDALALP